MLRRRRARRRRAADRGAGRARCYGGADAARARRAGGVHRALDHLVAVPRRLVARGQPHARLRRGASPARWRSCGWSRAAGRRCSSGVALGCVLVCGWALATKVFPSALAADETFARLREPFGYWNAVGLMAALGVPPLLWLAARRSGHAGGQRARVAGARAAVRLHDALLLARRAAGAADRPRVLVRRRAAAPARRCCRWSSPRSPSAPVVGVGVRARRALDRATSRSPRAPTPATSSARCCC